MKKNMRAGDVAPHLVECLATQHASGPWFLHEQCIKPYVIVHACCSRIQKVKAEGSEVQDHPRLNSKFETAFPTLESV